MKVFISYAQADEKLAEKVGDSLKQAGLTVWDYRRDILPSDLWSEKASQALRDSDAMVVLLTPEATRSKQVRSEIDYALTKNAFKNRLIPVLVGSPERIAKKDLPWILWQLQMVMLPERGNQQEGIRQIARTLLEAA
jgi:TIR domain